MSENVVNSLEDIMKDVSNMLLDGDDESTILSKISDSCIENSVDAEQVIVDVNGIHEILNEQKASKKKIQRVMADPMTAYAKAQHTKTIKSFILEIKDYAYQHKKSKEIKEILEQEKRFYLIMFAKNKSLASLRDSIPKIVRTVREMEEKGKTEDETVAFLYKYLFSYLKM